MLFFYCLFFLCFFKLHSGGQINKWRQYAFTCFLWFWSKHCKIIRPPQKRVFYISSTYSYFFMTQTTTSNEKTFLQGLTFSTEVVVVNKNIQISNHTIWNKDLSIISEDIFVKFFIFIYFVFYSLFIFSSLPIFR